ncbi:hypothetical protein [Methylococcus geothermalis]|uniref:Uncharacterized protein n=1 Tax=Methylococcus geothermalis TaxID=2681310 RepID=A0A858Q691_9GAMM|nr:hypothetical protein [Methylococcus geothermalis]QJD29360.1 hypothetical protein GNH96_04850 [Methylococcus geothermalis]
MPTCLPRKPPSAVRLPPERLRCGDIDARPLESEPHVSVPRSAAIRRLIVLGLDDAGHAMQEGGT